MPTVNETSAFLAQVKTALQSNNYRILDQRYKYLSTLSQLGIVQQDVIDDIKGLTINENNRIITPLFREMFGSVKRTYMVSKFISN